MIPSQSVLNRYGSALSRLNWQLAPAGLSGAAVWRGEDETGPLIALKQWPPDYPAARLAGIHGWMAQATNLPFLPSVLPANDGSTVVLDSNRIWDATRWMPGSPREVLETEHVESACAAIAQLHAVWRGESKLQACPGVRNRLTLLREWLASPPSQPHGFAPGLESLARRATTLVHGLAVQSIRELEPWEHIALPVQPCVRDLRAEHVLFTGGRVSGIVDFGAMALDHPAVDLARFLGDLDGLTAYQFGIGLQSYRRAGGAEGITEEWVQQLARGGVLGSAIIWLRRLASGEAKNQPMNAVEKRLAHLVRRLEKFTPI